MRSRHDDQSQRKGKRDKRQRTPSPTKRQLAPKSEVSNKTGASPSREEGQPLSSVPRKVAVKRTRLATTGILRSGFFMNEDNADQARIVPSCTSKMTDLGERQPKTDDVKDSNMIAQNRGGGNSLQVPEMEHVHAKGKS